MTHLYIELNTGLTEEVNSSIISKLYELAISGDLDNTSDLKGRLHSGYGYGVEVQYLTETFSDLYITLDKSYIKFADAAILDKMKKYIGDGNGATILDVQNILVFGGPRNTSSFGTLLWITKYNDKILPTTFDEFELFINVTELYAKTFESWINLLSIKLPPNITTIGTLCFDQCHKLTSLAGLSNITTIPNYAFRNCSKLETIDIDFSLVTEIGNRAFLGCQSLTFSGIISADVYHEFVFAGCKNLTTANVDFSTCTAIHASAFCESGLSGKLYLPLCTSVSNEAFKDVSGITEVDAPELTSIHKQALVGCTQISKISVPKLETEILCNGFRLLEEYNAPKQKQLTGNNFANCTSLTTLVLDFGEITTIPNWAFLGCTSLSGTLDFAKVTSIGTEIFHNCTFDVIFRATTFPTLTGYNQMGNFKGTLYVDDSLLVDYQTQFPGMGSRIKGISELPNS